MDEFFQMSPGSILWMEMEEAQLLIDHHQSHNNNDNTNNSAFVMYTNLQPPPPPPPPYGFAGLPRYGRNVQMRMMQFWRNWAAMRATTTVLAGAVPEMGQSNVQKIARTVSTGAVPEMGRSNVQKIVGQRMRRRQHKQGYEALLGLLPTGTKSDQKSILEMATKEITKLQQYKEELEKNIETSHAARIWQQRGKDNKSKASSSSSEVAEIKLKVTNPASGVDSMIEVLDCMKATGSTVHALKSHFSDHEFTAELQFETKRRAEDVEKAVQRTLYDTERKFRDKAL